MKRRTANILVGVVPVGLLLTLTFRLTTVPGGMILSGLTLGIMWIILIVMACLLVTLISRRFLKKISFVTIFSLTTTIGFAHFHYMLYSPTLTVIVPPDYTGEVDLVLADIKENILTVDTNGIGYINQWTFDKTYTRPTVIDRNGNNLDSLLVSFNPTTFWGSGKNCCIDKKLVYSKSFKIERNKTENTFKYRDLTDLVDRSITKKMKPDRYTIIQTDTTVENY